MDGTIRGNVPYMSPEHLRGEPVDRRSDARAASVVLWEMLTGERLFDGDRMDIVVAQVHGFDVPPPSERGALPMLDGVLRRGVSLAKEERYASAREMAVAIEGAVRIAKNRTGELVDGKVYCD